MSGPTCRCGRPTTGAYLCDHCAFSTLAIALANIAAYHDDLDTMRARTRAVRYDLPRGKGGTKELPLVVDARFADTGNRPDGDRRLGQGTALDHDTRNTITTWVRVAADDWPPLTPALCDDALCRRCNPLAAEARLRRPPVDGIASCCAYLVRMLRHIAGAPWGPQLYDELLDLERRLHRFVDNPPERWYAGPCTVGQSDLGWAALCGAELYAVMDHDDVTCRECGWTYSLTDRRAWLLAAAEDRWETAADLARAIAVLAEHGKGESYLAGRIRDWASPRAATLARPARPARLTARDTVTVKGRLRPRYRLGDVLDLLAADTPQTTAETA